MIRIRLAAIAATVVATALSPAPAPAAELEIPHAFAAGTPAVASQVNANFAAIKAEADAKDARIADLEAQVATLLAAVDALQASSLMAIEPYVSLESVPDPNDAGTSYATVRITGANLQVVNGSGTTWGEHDGLGNLIVGYNEADTASALQACSNGAWGDQSTCESNGGTWASSHRGGSHNIVLGPFNAYSRHGGLVGGRYNVINGNEASVLSGVYNRASGNYASVAGGQYNHASGLAATVGGGDYNDASGTSAAVSGGRLGLASGALSSVHGGYGNEATADHASVGGGLLRSAGDEYDWAAGSLIEDQ